MWSPLALSPPRSVAPGGDELRPPVGEVRRHLHPHARQQPAGRDDEVLHLLERDARGPGRQVKGVPPAALAEAGAPEPLRGLVGDVGDLLAVVGVVGDEVLQDDLLQVAELGVHGGERLERGDPVGVVLADPGQDAAREGDPQLAGGPQAGQPRGRGLRRGPLVGDEVVADGLEHEALRGGDLPQPREVLAAEDAEVRVRQQPALQRALARPHDVGREVRVAPGVQALADGRVDLRPLAGQDEQLLDVALRGAVEEPQDLAGLVEVRLVGLERAVLAEALARP